MCLCCLELSLVIALTSANPRREVFWELLRLPRLGPSRRIRFTKWFTDLAAEGAADSPTAMRALRR